MKALRALIIEGGGMKAAYANGVLAAFEDADYAPWDLVIGTSAGGALAAWYSAGQARFATTTWKYATDRRVLSLTRPLLRRGPMLDHDRLFELVYEGPNGLDVEAVQACKWPVMVTAADADTGETSYVDVRPKNTFAWLKATGRLPIGSNGPITIDGRRWVDGGCTDPIPAQYVVEKLGATDVTVISNKPLGLKSEDSNWVVEKAAKTFPALRYGLEQHQAIKWASMQYLLEPPKGVTARLIYPQKETDLSRLSRNKKQIQAALDLGEADGNHFLQQNL